MAVEPKTKADQEKMGIALNRLAQEDPSFRVRTDEESGQTIISGMGELHLEIIVDRMKREFGVEANVGKPQVAYRETIRKPVESRRQVHQASRAARGQYGHVVAQDRAAASRARASSSSTRSRAARCRANTFRRSNKGVDETLPNGVLAGYPGRRRQGHAVRRLVPRRRLERERVQDGGVDRRSRTACARPARCCSSR